MSSLCTRRDVQFSEITSPRLLIRPATASDAEEYLELLSSKENYPYESCEIGLTIERIHRRIGVFAESMEKGENAFMVIVLRETGQIIGHGGYNTFEMVKTREFLNRLDAPAEQDAKMTDIGIMIDHKHWRRGYGLEAVSVLVENAVSELGCEAFRMETGFENEPWRGLMRTVGLGGLEKRGRASFDETVECFVWRFGVEEWASGKRALMEGKRWLL